MLTPIAKITRHTAAPHAPATAIFFPVVQGWSAGGGGGGGGGVSHVVSSSWQTSTWACVRQHDHVARADGQSGAD
jgi:hypothetical protein